MGVGVKERLAHEERPERWPRKASNEHHEERRSDQAQSRLVTLGQRPTATEAAVTEFWRVLEPMAQKPEG